MQCISCTLSFTCCGHDRTHSMSCTWSFLGKNAKDLNWTFINKNFDRYCFGKGLLTCLKQGNHFNPSKIDARDDFRPNTWT